MVVVMGERSFDVVDGRAWRIIAATGAAGSQPEVSSVVGPMFGRVAAAIQQAGGRLDTGVATYAMGPDGGIEIVAGFSWDGEALPGFDIVELPGVLVASTTHLGVMATIGESWSALMRWVGEHGFDPAGPGREIYHESSGADQRDWVTELQQPVTRR